MKNANKWMNYLIGVFGLIVYFLIVVAVLNTGLNFNYTILLIFTLVALLFCLQKREKIKLLLKRHKKVVKIIMIILIIMAFAMRFSFLFIGDRLEATIPRKSDPGVLWYGAQEIVDNEELDEELGEFDRIFPYLMSYTGVLSGFMSVVGKSYLAVLSMNILFDAISCVIIFTLFNLWKRDKEIAWFAATVWAVNPLQIMFCSLPLAIIVVNMFVLLSILLVFLLFYYKNNATKVCVLSLLVGLVFGLGNAFRPVFIIFLLATIFYWTIKILQEGRLLKKMVLSSCIMIVAYFVTGLFVATLQVQINPYYHGESPRPGWGVFVGSNYENQGRWSKEDSVYFFEEVLEKQTHGDIEQAQSIILGVAIDRYIDLLSRGELVQHFFNKISSTFGDVRNATRDFPTVFGISHKNKIYNMVQDLISIFYLFLLAVVGYEVYIILKAKERFNKNGFIVFLTILFAGLFMAFMLVEAMNRYSLPFVAILIVIALGMVFRGKSELNCCN